MYAGTGIKSCKNDHLKTNNKYIGAKMNTPVYDYLLKYADSGFLRMHMPGHKGTECMKNLSSVCKYDITEITDAGNLFSGTGIIAESEKNAGKLFGTKGTFYTTGGSTVGIQTMMALMKYENRHVIALRNAHHAFLSACVLLDIDVDWVYPEYRESIISGTAPYDIIEEKLQKNPDSCLYLTSPDYFGSVADISTLSELCHRYDAVLVVDNAHGACLPFYEKNMHPIANGADLCCDSAHKMLPALTGAAYIHSGNERYLPLVKEMSALFATTSPSYLITCSMDLCNDYLDTKIRADLKKSVKLAEALREHISHRFVCEKGPFYHEPLHFTINASKSGINGIVLAEKLRENKVEYEYADDTHIVMLFSPVDTEEKYLRLEKVLDSIKFTPETHCERNIDFPVLEKCMSIRSAALSPHEEIPVKNAAGRICANVHSPCPPAIPVAVSGEMITEKCTSLMEEYGIETVKVVKK